MANIKIGQEWEEYLDPAFMEFLDLNLTVGEAEVLK